ncbi:MAG: hypothetical protein ACKVP7_17025 [Hyphomicrobiaceae bacterium]
MLTLLALVFVEIGASAPAFASPRNVCMNAAPFMKALSANQRALSNEERKIYRGNVVASDFSDFFVFYFSPEPKSFPGDPPGSYGLIVRVNGLSHHIQVYFSLVLMYPISDCFADGCLRGWSFGTAENGIDGLRHGLEFTFIKGEAGLPVLHSIVSASLAPCDLKFDDDQKSIDGLASWMKSKSRK